MFANPSKRLREMQAEVLLDFDLISESASIGAKADDRLVPAAAPKSEELDLFDDPDFHAGGLEYDY